MDENKRKILKEIGYRIRPVCGMCVKGEFPSDDWGTCSMNTYSHLKHTGNARNLSIHRYGCCEGGFELDEEKISSLHKFGEFYG